MPSNINKVSPKIAIIGAGMSGLSAAHILKDRCVVTLFDKSRGVGGRMSTRYAGDYEFDHGAQYFTIQDAAFKTVIDEAIELGVAAPWTGRALYLKSGQMIADTGGDRYVGTPRMNSLPKFLAQSLDIKLGERVSGIVKKSNGWQLNFETGDSQSGFDAVICSAPPAQAQAILPAQFSAMPAVKSAKMQACFALMIGLKNVQDFGWDSLRLNDLPIAWMAVNSQKPGRHSGVSCLMIHADGQWSERHQNADRAWVQTQLLETASTICGADLKRAEHIALHRWLYASVELSPNTDCLFDPALKLAACGDWCQGGRVEGAWRSGVAAGQKILAAVQI